MIKGGNVELLNVKYIKTIQSYQDPRQVFIELSKTWRVEELTKSGCQNGKICKDENILRMKAD